MTVVLMEGFDNMGTIAKLTAAKGWTDTAALSSLTGGRFTGNALRFTKSGASSALFAKNLPASLSQFVVGFAIRVSQFPAATGPIFLLRSGTTGTVQVRMTSAGKIEIANSGGTSIATGTTILTAGSWFYVEVKVLIAGAAGAVTVHINGGAEIATTTANFGSTNVDNVVPAMNVSTAFTTNGTTVDFDDIYVVNTAASPNNDFLGEQRVETLFPNADGAHSDYTPNSGTAHFSRVNEASGTYPDDDTSYVSDSTVGHRDSYAFDDLVAIGSTIAAVQTNLYARKDDVGTRQLAAVVRQGVTDYDGATVTLSSSYNDYTEIRETDPSTSAAWTISGVNSAEFGVKTVA